MSLNIKNLLNAGYLTSPLISSLDVKTFNTINGQKVVVDSVSSNVFPNQTLTNGVITDLTVTKYGS